MVVFASTVPLPDEVPGPQASVLYYRDGHTVLPVDQVLSALRAEGVDDVAAAVVAAVDSGDVLEHEPPFDPES